MMIKKYNLLSVPFFAFFSKKAYRDVGKNWRGVNLTYLFLLLAVCCIPPTLIWRQQLVHTLDSQQMHLIEQLPNIEIAGGQVIIDQNQPYYITRTDGTPAIIIDTTGSMNYIDDPNVIALLMESSLIVRSGKDSFNTIDLSEVSEFHLNKYIAQDWMQIAREAMTPISYGVFLLASYAFAVVAMVLTAVIGLVLSVLMRGSMRFGGALRVATVAATPSIIFMTISFAMGLNIALEIYLAVTLIYLVVGVKACAKPLEISEQGQVDLKSFLHEEEFGIENAA